MDESMVRPLETSKNRSKSQFRDLLERRVGRMTASGLQEEFLRADAIEMRELIDKLLDQHYPE
jgi:hypothetical protein